MTYREKIQQMVDRLGDCYHDSGWLRDLATLDEQAHWNEFRSLMEKVSAPLERLDNSLSESRAFMETDRMIE